jgi:predicted enzyme related to lactoylglutathione lyase
MTTDGAGAKKFYEQLLEVRQRNRKSPDERIMD